MLFLLTNAGFVWSQTCPFEPWMSFRGTQIWRTPDGAAYAYKTSQVAIDADGAPRAYCPGDTGLDALANANYPKGDWKSVLVPDPKDTSKPFVQSSGPGKGCYLAGTSLRSNSKADTDGEKYVDATVVPYLVFPTGFGQLPGTGFIGDFAVLRSGDSKHISGAIVGDSGGARDSPLGEISIALAEALGATTADARKGAKGITTPVTVVVFRKSYRTPKWPVDLEQIKRTGPAMLEALGGWAAVDKCALPN
jgi:hypothetical protein